MRYLTWLIDRLRNPRAAYAAIAIAVVLVLPSLFSGFFIDEYIQAARWKAAFDKQQGIFDFMNNFLDSRVQQMMRNPSSHPFHKGDLVELSNMTATVTEITDDGRPKTVEFRFSAPLESSEWLWMRGKGFFGLVDWTPPKVGETVVVKAGF